MAPFVNSIIRLIRSWKLFILGIGILTAYPAQAQTTWNVAPGRSSINFKISHLLFMSVEGKFKKFKGRMIAPKNGSSAAPQWEGRVRVDSISTGIKDRDQHLLTDDFFDSSNYPEIVFRSKSVQKTGKGTCKILGDITIRDVTRSFELVGYCAPVKKLSNGKSRMDFVGTGSLNRFDFGLTWNDWLESGQVMVGKEVEITVKLSLLNKTSS